MVIIYVNDGTMGTVFNHSIAPWSDVRVRRAAHPAMDREPVRQTVTADEGKTGFGPVPHPQGLANLWARGYHALNFVDPWHLGGKHV